MGRLPRHSSLIRLMILADVGKDVVDVLFIGLINFSHLILEYNLIIFSSDVKNFFSFLKISKLPLLVS